MMRQLNHSAAVILFLSCLASAGTAAAQYGVIYDFESSHGDPVHPAGTLRADAKGALFGTAGDGSTFELKSDEHGGWAVTKTPNGPGGRDWIPDASGNYFTCVEFGGQNFLGTIVESSPAQNGSWTQKVIYTFGSSSTGGSYPYGSLVFDVQGNLYGTTTSGGKYGSGTVFELIQGASGKWTEKVLYNFGAISADAIAPQGLTIDAMGNLYGTSALGGPDYYNEYGDTPVQGGTLFQLTRQSSGVWQENILIDFPPSVLGEFEYQSEGAWDPAPVLVVDKKGNIFGTTYLGISYGCCSGPSNAIAAGTFFELSPAPKGQWTLQFQDLDCLNQVDCYVNSPLTMDPEGYLYFTTARGGSNLGVDDGLGDTVSLNTCPMSCIASHLLRPMDVRAAA